MNGDLDAAIASPATCCVFLLGDWNFRAQGERDFAIDKAALSTRDEGRNFAKARCLHERCTELSTEGFTHHCAAHNSLSRTDCVYVSFPAWACLLADDRAEVLEDPAALSDKGLSSCRTSTGTPAKTMRRRRYCGPQLLDVAQPPEGTVVNSRREPPWWRAGFAQPAQDDDLSS